MNIEQVVPHHTELSLPELLGFLKDSSRRLEPFHPETLQFCESLSRTLFSDSLARQFPETQALAFKFRKAELQSLRRQFEKLNSDTFLAPRGVAFHVAPANVDTIFLYSWLFSILAGNVNIIRLSQQDSPQMQVLCEALRSCMAGADGGRIRKNTVVIRYGHETEITAALSAIADLRIIWGGNATVDTIRSFPVKPTCKDMTFADRYSWSVVNSVSYLAASSNVRSELAASFYNDLYSFHQMACSSLRISVWHGEAEDCENASRMFIASLRSQMAKKNHATDVSLGLRKLTFACETALSQQVSSIHTYGSDLTVIRLTGLKNFTRMNCGGGLLFHYQVKDLIEVSDFVTEADQTLTYFGYSRSELQHLVRQLNGRGLERVVPVGQALTFGRY